MKTAIIVIGDEVLSGITRDKNAHYLALRLNELGFAVHHMLFIADTDEAITGALDFLMPNHELILTTGGLGPTKDDITKKVLCDYFDTKAVFNQSVYEQLEKLFKARKKDLNLLNKTQATFPEKAEVLTNHVGTAPGMCFQKNGHVVLSFPGVPHEVQEMFKREAVPKIHSLFDAESVRHINIMTLGTRETVLAEKLKNTDLPEGFKLAYLPNLGRVKLRLTASGLSSADFQQKANRIKADFLAVLGEKIYSLSGASPQEAIGELLTQLGFTVSTAESCTGGYLAHLLTSVAGSSAYFSGSALTYSNEIKQSILGVSEHILTTDGAVSEACVREMAEKVRLKFGTTYAMATSGIAGPSGGSEEKPVGTVWMAVASEQEVVARKMVFNRGRLQNIELSTIYVLSMLYAQILKENGLKLNTEGKFVKA